MTERNKKAERGDARSADAKRGSDEKNPKNRQSELGKRLDEALEETFPSSDPVSVKITK